MNNNNSKLISNDKLTNVSKEKFENIKQIIIYYSKRLDNELFFQKNYGDRETLFYVSLSSFKKPLEQKDESDNKLISLYLTQMKKFVELIQKVSNSDEKTTKGDDFYDLMEIVSNHILYNYFPANRVLMRYGDEGEKFYILLNGTINIIVPSKNSVNISLNEYFRYIALLIIYKEQQILKQVIRENKNVNYVDIPGIDYFFVVSNDSNPLILIRNLFLKKIYKNEKNGSKTEERFNYGKFKKKFDKKKIRRKSADLHQKKINYKDLDKELIKVEEFLNIYLTNEELNFYKNSLIDENYEIFEIDDNIIVSPQQYIKRIQNYSYSRDFLKDKKINNIEEKLDDITNNEKILKLFIYEYKILVELNSGDMFGEAALSAPSLKRNATIMTVTDCHFGCLNRKIYQKHIQKATETIKRNIINYICNTGIFNKFPKEIISRKFFSSFVFKKNKKNDLLIKQREMNNNIILTKEGVYEIILNGSMHDIYNLINIYYKNLIEFDKKNNEQDEEMYNKITKMKDQESKIEKILGHEMYKNEEHKIFLIDSPSTFGLRETEEKITIKDNVGNISYNYISYYDVKCNSLKGEYILIDKNAFYKQIYAQEYSVQESSNIISRQFIEKILNRLLNIRLGKIYNLLLLRGFNKENNSYINDKNTSSEIHHNSNYNYSDDFFNRISLLIDNCDENKFSSNNYGEYVYNYFENKKEKNSKEKREFKNKKQKFKENKIKNMLIKEHSDLDFINSNSKNFSLNRISSAINNRTKLTLHKSKDKSKDKDKNIVKTNLRKKNKNKFLQCPSVLKNKRSYVKLMDNLKNINFKSKVSFSPKNRKKFTIQTNKLYKDIMIDNKNIFSYKLKHKNKNKNKIMFQDSFLSIYNNKNNNINFSTNLNENEDNKNNNEIITYKNSNRPKLYIIGGKHLVTIPKILLNKSKSVYEIKEQNQQNFINNRRNYIINITRSFFTKQKDFNRKIRLKSS